MLCVVVDNEKKYTRKEAGDILGISKESVRRLQKKGAAKSELDGRGVHTFTIGELRRVAEESGLEFNHPEAANNDVESEPEAEVAAPEEPPDPLDDGELAARVFDALETGETVATIIKEQKIAPSVMERLHPAWLKTKVMDLGALDGETRLQFVERELEREREATKELASRLADVTARLEQFEAQQVQARAAGLCPKCRSLAPAVEVNYCGICDKTLYRPKQLA